MNADRCRSGSTALPIGMTNFLGGICVLCLTKDNRTFDSGSVLLAAPSPPPPFLTGVGGMSSLVQEPDSAFLIFTSIFVPDKSVHYYLKSRRFLKSVSCFWYLKLWNRTRPSSYSNLVNCVRNTNLHVRCSV